MWSVAAAVDRRRHRSTVSRTAGIFIAAEREPRHVAGARVLAGRVEAVGADEVRVGEPEPPACAFISVANAGKLGAVASASASAASLADWIRARLDEVGDRDAARRPEVDRLLADGGRAGIDADDVPSFRCWSATITVISFVIEAIGVR